ncbi:MAG TPA: TetR/AcrR family transcriptional regulator [Acidimicrobiales bacterium]|nr:TetR/AcrR family transcriptional regulator [Acidimicrobiales bacterium]
MAPSKTDPRTRVLAAIELATAGRRRDGDSDAPLGRKAARTRAALLEAAGRVFMEQGYASTSVGDIATEAGVSLGAFYQYFRDRADVLATLVAEGALRMLEDASRQWQPVEGREGVHQVLHAFVSHYRATAKFQKVWEEVTHVEGELAELRRELVRIYTAAVEQSLRDGQANGSVRADLDAAGAAVALTSMVDRTCYLRFVFDRQPGQGVAPTVDALTDIWWAAVKP